MDGGSSVGSSLPPLQEAKIKGNVNHVKWHQMNDAMSQSGSLDEEQGEHSDDYERPSQAGEHDARRQHPFGEDPLGSIENNRKHHKGYDSLTPKWTKNSPLSLETMERGGLLQSLSSYLKSKSEKKEFRRVNYAISGPVSDKLHI